jgi:hypothetical protein
MIIAIKSSFIRYSHLSANEILDISHMYTCLAFIHSVSHGNHRILSFPKHLDIATQTETCKHFIASSIRDALY